MSGWRYALTLALVLGASDAFAYGQSDYPVSSIASTNQKYFVNSSKQFGSFNGDSSNSCGSCHTTNKKTSLRLSAPQVSSGATSTTLSLGGKASNATRYYWRFRVGSSGSGTYVERLPTSTVSFSATDPSPDIEYCIAEKSGTTRNWNCSEFEIERRNDAPVISPISNRNLDDGDTATVSVSVDDESPGTVQLSVSSNSNPAVVDVTKLNGNQFRLTARRPGTSNVTIRAQDNKGATDTDTFTVNVAEVVPPNRIPEIAEIPDESLTVGQEKSIDVSVDDENPATVTLSITGNTNSTVVSAAIQGGNVVLDALSAGNSLITVRAVDEEGDSDTELFSVTVVALPPPNVPPVLAGIDDQTLGEGQSRTLNLSIVDEDPDSVSLDVTGNSDSSVVSVSAQGGERLQLSAQSPGTSTVTVRATDNKGDVSDSVSFEVTVTADEVDLAPSIATIATQSLEPDESRTVDVIVSDEDTGSVTLSVTSNSNSGVVTAEVGSGSTVALTAIAAGTSQITLTAKDQAGQTGTTTFTVEVSSPVAENKAPTISGLSDLSLQAADTRSIDIEIQDENPDSVELTIVSNSNPSSVNASLDSRTLKLEALLPGSATIELQAKDIEGLNSSVSIDVNITRAAVPPVIIEVKPAGDFVLEAGDQFIVELDLDDSEEDSFEFSASSSNESVVTIAHQDDGKYEVTAIAQGNAVLSLIVRNSFNLQAQTDIAVTVNAADEAPLANDDQFVFVFQSDSQSLDVLANDSDKENSDLTILLDSAQSDLGGSISVGDAVVNYQPPSPFSQQDSFTYKVMDSAGNTSNRASVSVLPSDTDGDGAFDGSDNCPIFANADQQDDDSDMIGNLCDADPDGDGDLGEAGRPFTTGKSLVESVCLDCHLEGVQGAPAFGDTDAWRLRVDEAGGIPPLLNSVSLGKGAMPAWGSEYSARELTQAILYLTGLEDPGLSGNFIDRDLDGINDFNDNCINHANADQLDSNNNGVGNDCEPDSNNDGVLDYSLSFQFFQETPSGRVTGGIVKAGAGQVTVLARTRADIEGLSYDWSNSDEGILALFESDPSSEVVTFTPTGNDIGVYNLDVTVLGEQIRGKTRARLVVVDSPLSTDLSDQDYDGYPASLDNDNANANRVLSDSNSAAGSSVFYSNQSITLGAFTAQQAASSGYARAKATLSQAEFLAAAQRRYPDVSPVADSTIDNSIGVMDFELRDLDAASATIRLKLLGNIPLNASLRIYNPREASWRNFSGIGADSVASAPQVSGECPASGSPNYTNGLVAGQSCVRFSLSDGGPNDADGTRDGVIAMTGVIGSLLSDPVENEQPGAVDINPSKSGGGKLSWLLIVIMSGLVLRRVRHQQGVLNV